MKPNYLLLLLLIFVSLKFERAHAQDFDLFEKKLFISQTDTLPYRILLPENFDSSKKYPIVLFLHGRGESGKDNEKQLTHGAELFLRDSIRTRYPAIVIFPQCSNESFWSNVYINRDRSKKGVFNFVNGGKPTQAMQLLLGLVKEFKDKSYVDKDRIYVGGLSMGGMGTFEILRRETNTFAAAFAICGGDDVQNVKEYRKIPLWVFHGEKDDIVPPRYSEIVVNELKRLGSEVRYTNYPNANHNSWDSAFAEPDFLQWIFSHKK